MIYWILTFNHQYKKGPILVDNTVPKYRPVSVHKGTFIAKYGTIPYVTRRLATTVQRGFHNQCLNH